MQREKRQTKVKTYRKMGNSFTRDRIDCVITRGMWNALLLLWTSLSMQTFATLSENLCTAVLDSARPQEADDMAALNGGD